MTYLITVYWLVALVMLVSMIQVSRDEPYKSRIAEAGFSMGIIMVLMAVFWPATVVVMMRGNK